jgi:hypothetical protein
MGNYVSLAERIITMRMRECLCANAIATRLGVPISLVHKVFAQEGIS